MMAKHSTAASIAAYTTRKNWLDTQVRGSNCPPYQEFFNHFQSIRHTVKSVGRYTLVYGWGKKILCAAIILNILLL